MIKSAIFLFIKHPHSNNFSAVYVNIFIPVIPLLTEQILNVGIAEQPEMIEVHADIKTIGTI